MGVCVGVCVWGLSVCLSRYDVFFSVGLNNQIL